MNVLQILDAIVQAVIALGQAAPNLTQDVTALWTELQTVYQDILAAITSFTAPTQAQVDAAQAAVGKVNDLLAAGKEVDPAKKA